MAFCEDPNCDNPFCEEEQEEVGYGFDIGFDTDAELDEEDEQ